MSLARSEDEIVRAHDLLVGLILGEGDIEVQGAETMMAAADVLCWLLGHDHNTNFGANLTRLEAMMAEHGMRLRPLVPEVFYDDESVDDIEN